MREIRGGVFQGRFHNLLISKNNPRSRGCGRQERILPCRCSLVPGMVNTYGLTNQPMIILEAMDLQEGRIVHGEVDQRHWRKERKHHGRCRRGCRAYIAGDVSSMSDGIEE